MDKKSTAFLSTILKSAAVFFSSILLFGILGTFLSPYSYFFDNFSHIKMQYLIGSIVMLLLTLALKQLRLSLILLIAFVYLAIDTRHALRQPLKFSPGAAQANTITVASFNHFLFQDNYAALEKWLSTNSGKFDVIALIEAQKQTSIMAGNLRDQYPHQILYPQSGSNGMIILSKHPFLEQTRTNFDMLEYKHSFSLSIKIKPPQFENEVTIHAIHPPAPINKARWDQRNAELALSAKTIQAQSGHIIVIGDFNNSQYNPFFRRFLKDTDLNIQSYGLFQNPTWPTGLKIPLLQIPIDHILYSDTLYQHSKTVGPALGSDHHPIVATLSENK